MEMAHVHGWLHPGTGLQILCTAGPPFIVFLMSGVYPMHRWSALVEIVRSFNERGSPRLAFASVALFVLLPLIALGLALAAGVPAFSRGL